jgi:hypothetical protein
MKEIELYPAIHELFDTPSTEIFTEVPAFRRRPDIVLRQGNIITTIEMKTSLSIQLIEQAIYWIGKAHIVYIAVPARKRGEINVSTQKHLMDKGIGIILVNPDKNTAWIHTKAKPSTTRYDWSSKLLDIYKGSDYAGGSAGAYMTPYKHMMNLVKKYIFNNPKVSADDIIKNVKEVGEHYRHPHSSLTKALTEYEHWCFIVRPGVRNLYYTKITRTPIKL